MEPTKQLEGGELETKAEEVPAQAETIIPITPEPKWNPKKAFVSIILYMACSSSMLIINKVGIVLFPYPTTLLLIQLAISSISIKLLSLFGVMQVEPLKWDLIKQYYGVVCVFLANIYTNIKALQYSNVETVIIFRTCTTLAVAYGDYKFLNRGIPNFTVLSTLIFIVVGALLYVYTDSTFRVESYLWVGLYFCCQCADVLYIKHIVNQVPMSSWGRSFYNNTLAIIPLLFVLVIGGEGNIFYQGQAEPSNWALVIIVVSSLAGLLLSVSGFMCRDCVSATSFSVVGNMNKILTVFINFVIWDKHASLPGLLSLAVCLFSGALYTHFVQNG